APTAGPSCRWAGRRRPACRAARRSRLRVRRLHPPRRSGRAPCPRGCWPAGRPAAPGHARSGTRCTGRVGRFGRRHPSCPNYWLGPGSGLRYGPAMDDADGYFPERVAATYDDSSEGMFDPAFIDTVAEVLAGLAGGGRALEFGIGTGRIALPLARRGVEVHGIDLSRAMVTRLRAKPGRAAIPVAIGD